MVRTVRLLLHKHGAPLVGAPVRVAAPRRASHDPVHGEVRREQPDPRFERVDVIADVRPVVRVFAVAADDVGVERGRLADDTDRAALRWRLVSVLIRTAASR